MAQAQVAGRQVDEASAEGIRDVVHECALFRCPALETVAPMETGRQGPLLRGEGVFVVAAAADRADDVDAHFGRKKEPTTEDSVDPG